MYFFKYLKRAYAEDLVRHGKVRIGTIYEYRNYIDPERKDESEGTKLARLKIEEETYYGNKPDEWPLGLKTIFTAPDEPTNDSYTFKNLTVINPMIYEDAFIYCVSSKFDKKVMLDFGCDTCVLIKDIEGFCNTISQRMVDLNLIYFSSKSNISNWFNPCIYNGKESDEKVNDAYWLKEAKYIHQNEFRLVMSSKKPNATLKPQIIRCRDLPKYCEIIKL